MKRRTDKKISRIKDQRYDMEDTIKCIKFSGDKEIFDEWKENNKEISRQKEILKYLTKKWDIPKLE